MHPDRRALAPVVALLALLLGLVLGCRGPATPNPTATEDAEAVATDVAARLAATLTAKAPPTATATMTPVPPTPTPTPTRTPQPTPTPTPTAGAGDQVAFVLTSSDGSANVVLGDETNRAGQVLTHFVEPYSMCDVSWSSDGEWLAVVSAHDFVRSRNNERNVFVLQADGTDLQMVTGDYLDPASAEGPFVSLDGVVVGCDGPALVSAQGVAAPVVTDDGGAFELLGVPVAARWARAVCALDEGRALQGDVDLSLAEGVPESITIDLHPAGSGWTQASLSPDGSIVAGIHYSWVLDEGGEQQQTRRGVLLDIRTGEEVELPLPEGGLLTGLAWSHAGDRLLGALATEEGAELRLWDASGGDLGVLLTIANSGEIAHSVVDPAWSPGDSRIAFSRRDWDWWGDTRYRAVIAVCEATGEGEARVVAESEWGTAAEHPTWTSGGTTLYYQVSDADPETACMPAEADIWRLRVDLEGIAPVVWRDDGRSYLPAVRPRAMR